MPRRIILFLFSYFIVSVSYAQIEDETIEIIEVAEDDEAIEKPSFISWSESYIQLSMQMAFLAEKSMIVHSPCDSFNVQALDSTDQLLFQYIHKSYFKSARAKTQQFNKYLPINSDCFDSMIFSCRYVSNLAGHCNYLQSTWDSVNGLLFVRDLAHTPNGPYDVLFKMEEFGKLQYALSLNEGTVKDSTSFSYDGCELVEINDYIFRRYGVRSDTGVFKMTFNRGLLTQEHWYNPDSNHRVVLAMIKNYSYTMDGKLKYVETTYGKGDVEQLMFSYDSEGMTIERIKSLAPGSLHRMKFRLEAIH